MTEHNTTEPDVLFPDEVAAKTRVPEATLRHWRRMNAGQGPTSFKLGRRVAYRRADVEAWLDEQYNATRS